MKMISLLKKSVLAAVLAGFCHSALAELHIIIPGGPGGGWDTTARSVGEALMKSGLESRTSFQNMSGGGGGRAIAYMIEIGNKKNDILMVNSTPIVIRALSGAIPFSHRDLTPVANLIADYGAFVVRNDSPLRRNVTIEDVGNVAAFMLSDLAGGVTSEITYVDGGFSHVMGGLGDLSE